MPGLVLDVSTERGMLAVFDQQQKKIFHEELPVGFQNSHFALPELEKKLQDHLFKLKDLSFISVGVGPGSYTGIRVGAAIAKSLAFVLQIPLIGICTLDTFIPNEEGGFATVIDAKIGGVYLQIGHFKKGQINQILGPKACSLQEAVELLKNISMIVTPNAGQIKGKLEKLSPKSQWNWQEHYPNPERMINLSQEKLHTGAFSMDYKLELLYMRKTQAEIERDNLS